MDDIQKKRFIELMEKQEVREHTDFTEIIDHDEWLCMRAVMREYGGSFIKALERCMSRADLDNLRRIKEAFPEYWEKYYLLGLKTFEERGIDFIYEV